MMREYIRSQNDRRPDRHVKCIIEDELITFQTAVPSAVFGGDATEITINRLDTRDGFTLLPVKIPASVPGEEFDESLAGERLLVYPEIYLSLPYLKTRHEWKDHCNWSLVPHRHENYSPVEYVANTTADSAYQRRHIRDTPFVMNFSTLLDMYVPFASVASFHEIGLRTVLLTPNSRLISNFEWLEAERTDDAMFPRRGLYPALSITGPQTILPDGEAELTVTPTRWGEIISNPIQVELETVNGYLPITRLHMSGPATFRARALGLKPGDTMKVKAGFRFFAGLAEHILEVAEE